MNEEYVNQKYCPSCNTTYWGAHWCHPNCAVDTTKYQDAPVWCVQQISRLSRELGLAEGRLERCQCGKDQEKK